MLFPTATFAVFCTVAYGLHVALRPHRRSWVAAMVAASAVFYGWYEPRLVILLVVSVIWNHVAARALGRRQGTDAGRWIQRVAVVGNLAALGWFKYATFVTVSAANFLEGFGVDVAVRPPTPLLPIGISFLTFQAIGYIVDIGRGKVAGPKNFGETALFLTFFPQLVAGPILRAKPFFSQLERPVATTPLIVGEAAMLIAAGLVKKVVISDALWTATTGIRANPDAYGGADVVLYFLAGAARVYCDVSSYSDIAIGVGLLFGFRFPINFAKPYAAASLSEFWRRWHISLSSWLRDYLFTPLRGAAPTGRRLAVAALVTMTLSGLWHGASWEFALWGLLHGIVLTVEGALRVRRIEAGRRRRKSKVLHVVGVAYTFTFLVITGNLFVGLSVPTTLTLLGRIGDGIGTPTLATPMFLGSLAVGIGVHFVPAARTAWARVRFAALPAAAQGAVMAVVVTVICAAGVPGVAPYLYYRF